MAYITSIIWHKYKELLETQNIDFKDIKDLLPKLDKFRRTFN